MSTEAIFLLRDGEESGPYAADDVRERVGRGEVSLQEWAWREGLPAWRPLDEVIGFNGLPPLPARIPAAEPRSIPPATVTTMASAPWSNYPPLATISAGLGLLLTVLSVFCVGSCTKAERDLQNYSQNLNSPDGAAEMFLRSLDRGMKGDPFGQFFDMADTRRSLEATAGEAQLWAVLSVIGTGICGVVLFLTIRQKASRKPH